MFTSFRGVLVTILMDGVGATDLGEELACDPYTTHPVG